MKESPQEKAYREMLPDSMRNMAQTSFSYQRFLKIVNNHLKTIYGDRADWDKCLTAYFRSSEYRRACHNGKRIGDIKLLQIDDIERMLHEERQYSTRINELTKCFHDQMGASSGADETKYIYKMASILGLLPEKNDQDLFGWLLQKSGITENEQEQLYKRIVENWNILSIVISVLAKIFLPGFLLKFPNIGCVMTQQRGKFYYRGENAFYKSSKASIFRQNNSLPPEVKDIVDRLRLYECWNLLDQFDAVKYWNYSEINYMALTQHYGLRTQMIDITSDLRTALFFACCRFGDDRKWYPLQKAEIEHINSRKYIAKLGGDSRYGILYRTPTEITDMEWAISDENAGLQIITPIGYQPFMRCSHQYSYMMLTSDASDDRYDLLRDPLFDKYKIRLDENLCKWIYEEMDCGNKIYPNDDIPDISQEIEKLNNQCIFSESVFQAVMDRPNVSKNEIGVVRQLLSNYGFAVQNRVRLIKTEPLAQINLQYSINDAMEKAKIHPQAQPYTRER